MVKKPEEISLNACKLKFCSEQLENLNFLFRKKIENHLEIIDSKLIHAKSVAERFVQRLMCGVGILDDRFSSKYLISLDDDCNVNKSKMTYLFRIDSLSTPVLYKDDSTPDYFLIEDDEFHPGFGKIQLKENMVKKWGEFINLNNFLRRDKIQSKIVELLAKSASKNDLIDLIDDSILCCSPGKVVSPSILNKILHLPTENHVYFGSEKNFPNVKDFRIAIVDEPEGIRIHLEFLSPVLINLKLDIRILVGINVDFWSMKSDFPFRISLGHTDCLLYNLAAKTGMFFVGFGVHSSSWQIRFPAAEEIILNHYNENSVIKMVLKVISLIFIEIKGRYLVNKFFGFYILKTAIFYELENDDSDPIESIIRWSPIFLSTIVLKILDKLIKMIRNEYFSNYFFPKSNLIFNPGHLNGEDYFIESFKIQDYLTKLFDDSLKIFDDPDYLKMNESVGIEMILLEKWKKNIEKMSPPKSTRAQRFSINFNKKSNLIFTQYTQKQIEYIALVLKNILEVQKCVWKNDENVKFDSNDPIDDVIYALITILEQAKNIFLKRSKEKDKIKLNFLSLTNKLVNLVRKDVEINFETIQDDVDMVKIVLKWLYKAMDQSKKYFAPILRPYLNVLFKTSHAISWHIEELVNKESNFDELESIGIFANLVNQKKITPGNGIVDCYHKKWIWAKNLLEILEKNSLKLVFVPKKGKVLTFFITNISTNSKKDILINQKISIFSNYFNNLLNQNKNFVDSNQPLHNILKNNTPLTLIFQQIHRNGHHRCAGDIFKTLIIMHKSQILIDIANMIDGANLLDYIKKIKNEYDKKRNNDAENRFWSQTLPQFEKKNVLIDSNKRKVKEKYTVLNEEMIGRDEKNIGSKWLNEDSLLGSCRAARLRDAKTMLYIEESFKFCRK